MFAILTKLENKKQPLLGPNIKALKFWGLLLPDNDLKKAFYLFMHFAVTVFTATEYIDVWFVKNDMGLLLTNLKITMLATVSVCKVTTFLAWQKYWKQIISYVVTTDLNQRNTVDKEKLEMIKGVTKYCRKITYSYWFLMYTTVVIVMFQPILKYFSSATYRDNVRSGNDTYLQVVSSWVPFNKNTIPGYLVASVYQTYAAIYGGGWITSFDTNAIVIMVFFKLELELLRIDCREIFGLEKVVIKDEEIKRRLIRCHKRHVELVKFARLLDSCLSPIMLLYMFVCSVMLCVTAYQITIESNTTQKFLMTEYLIFGVAQLFIYCWHSNDVYYAVWLDEIKQGFGYSFTRKGIRVLTTVYLRYCSNWNGICKVVIKIIICGVSPLLSVFHYSESLLCGPYESVWWLRTVKHRRDLLLLTGQFKKTVVFSAGPFTKLTITTFIAILKGAYSYYTLLSQSQMK